MFYKHLTSEERLRAWRLCRQKNYSSANELLEQFADVKPIPRYLDYYTPSEWPNVFEIVSEGYFCQSGLTLVIAATLYKHGFITSENLRFDVISNHINGNEGLVLVDNEKVYNFYPDSIISVSNMLENSTKFLTHVVPSEQLFR